MRGRLGVELADWNGDGRADMLVGQSAGVTVLFDNATKGEPVFKESEVLVRDKRGEENAGQVGKDYPGGRLKLHVADYNGDGLDDLLVGDVNGPATVKPRDSLTEEELREYEELKKRADATRRKIKGLVTSRDLSFDPQERARIQRQIMALFTDRDGGAPEKMDKYEEWFEGSTHGHVWVYLRKKDAEKNNKDPRPAFKSYRASGGRGVRVRLGPESETIQPGNLFRVGLLFELSEGWITYGGSKSSAQRPTTLDVQLPEEFKVAAVRWPEAHKLKTSFDGKSKDDLYTKDFVVTVSIMPPNTLSEDSLNIQVATDWQACKDDVCTLGESFNSLRLTTGKPRPTPVAAFFDSPAPAEARTIAKAVEPRETARTDAKGVYDDIPGLKYTSEEIQALQRTADAEGGSYYRLKTVHYGYHDKLPKSFLRGKLTKTPAQYNEENKTPFRYEVGPYFFKRTDKGFLLTPIREGVCDIYIVDVENKKVVAHNGTQDMPSLCVVCGADGYVGEVPNGTYHVIVVYQGENDLRLGTVSEQTFEGVEPGKKRKRRKNLERAAQKEALKGT